MQKADLKMPEKLLLTFLLWPGGAEWDGARVRSERFFRLPLLTNKLRNIRNMSLYSVMLYFFN